MKVKYFIFLTIVFWAGAFMWCAHRAAGPNKVRFQIGALMSVAMVGFNTALYYKVPRKKS